MNKTVLALGFFDGLHLGHAALLERAKARAAALDAESAILTFDNHPDTFVKGTPVELVNSAEDRAYIARRYYGIRQLYCIHFTAETMRIPWQDFMADVTESYGAVGFVVGHDFCCGWKGEGTAERIAGWCAERGIGCDIIPPVKLSGITVSSTHIRTLLRAGEMETAAAFLGRPHLLTDTVRTGHRIGRTMDYPTVNMLFAPGVLVPPHGVYATRITLPDGSEAGGVTNVGLRPTFDGDHVTVETHILDFRGDLYGQRLCVQFLHFQRPERRFDGPGALEAQIRADVAEAREFLKNA